jgi:MFS transporter, DHA2 family, multidrug resistance protein
MSRPSSTLKWQPVGEPSGRSAAEPYVVARAPANKWLITVSISFGTLMGAIDSSIVNVALPHLQGALGASVQEITWVSTGYAIALVLLMPLTAFLGRMFGQKRVYMLCLVLFLVGSALCGTARTLPQLVAYRALQGLGAGALQPTEQAILRQTFPPREQGMAMAVFAMVVMLGPAIGPALGGTIVDHLHWSWIFFINIPIGVIGLVMVASFVHDDEAIRRQNQALAALERRHVDYIGILLLSVGLATFEYFLEEGDRNEWFESTTISVCFLVALVSIMAFVVRELTAPAPVVNLRLFRDSVFASGTLIGGLMFALLMANMFLLPLFMQDLLGFTATQAGWALMPRALVVMVVAPFVGRLYNYVSPRLLVAIGIVAFAVGSYELSHLTPSSGQGEVITGIVIQGVGFGFLFIPLTTAALARVPRHAMADATGLNSLVRQLSGAIGLAIFVTLLQRYVSQARLALVAHVGATRPVAQQTLASLERAIQASGAVAGPDAHEAALRTLDAGVQAQANVLAYDRVFLLGGLVFLFVLPLLYFLRTDRGDQPDKVNPPEVQR